MPIIRWGTLIKDKPGLMEGLLARFYEWRDIPQIDLDNVSPTVETVVFKLNNVWLGKPDERLKSEYYVLEIKGYIKIDDTGSYRFHVTSNGGVKLWVNDSLLIDSWVSRLQKHVTNPVSLSKPFNRIRVLYYNYEKLGELEILWEKQGREPSEIPRKNLYFSIGRHAFITNIPDNYIVVATPVDYTASVTTKKCVSINNICTIELAENEQPLCCLISIYNENNEPVFRSTEPITIWGGDVYRFDFLVE